MTSGFALPAKYISHAVGPVWSGGNHGEHELLAGAYRSALELAHEHGCRRIAFPALRTGIFGYPLQAAAAIAVQTAREHMAEKTSLERVVFACFSGEVLEAYRAAGIAD